MDPNKKGWLKEFLQQRVTLISHAKEEEGLNKGQNPDQSFYGIIQPTGIMYGYPVNLLGYEGKTKWGLNEKIKVLIADSALNISQLYRQADGVLKEFSQENLTELVEAIVNFYNGVYQEISVAPKGWLRKKRNLFEQAEEILDRRIALIDQEAGNNFWLSFFGYSQIFLDMYIFSKWNITKPNQALIEYFREQKEELSYISVKVMAAASYANEIIEGEEKQLFDHFINSTKLSSNKKKRATGFFENGMQVHEIPVKPGDPWVLRKFFMELAILTVWSDKKVEQSERQFLTDFSNSVGFSDEEFENSMIAVEGFVLQYWGKLDSLQDKIDYVEVSEEYMSRIGKVVGRNKDRIINDIRKDDILLDLLRQGNTRELDDGQKEMARVRLFAVLQGIPSFRVIALPSEFLDYKTLIRIFPKDVFHSVIINDDLNE